MNTKNIQFEACSRKYSPNTWSEILAYRNTERSFALQGVTAAALYNMTAKIELTLDIRLAFQTGLSTI
jgi:hypothetical protein